jgi:hypothetical protein
MTHDEMIQLARQARMPFLADTKQPAFFKEVCRFVELIEAAERKKWLLVLGGAADAMRRIDSDWCAAHEVEQINDEEWDDALMKLEDALEVAL